MLVERSREGAASIDLCFGVVTWGGGSVRRASVLGPAALKNHSRLQYIVGICNGSAAFSRRVEKRGFPWVLSLSAGELNARV